MTIYCLVIILFKFWTSPFVYVQFCYLLTWIQVLRRQVSWSGTLICLRIFQFVVIHKVKDDSVMNEAEVDIFLEFLCFLHDPVNAGNFISGSPAFSKPSLYIRKFLIQVLLMPSLKDFEHNLTSMGSECNYPVVWTFFSTAGFAPLLHSPYWWLYYTSCFITV